MSNSLVANETAHAVMRTSIYQGGSPIAEPLTLFLIQLVLVVTLSKTLAFFFKWIKQPPVIAEIISGILLGPSVLGNIPGFQDKVFPDASLGAFGIVANVGLILFMYMVGLEVDTKIMKRNARASVIVSISAMIAPFVLGIASSYAIYNEVVDKSKVSFSAFLLFVAVAMSITAFPVLARLITEGKFLHTNVGTLALGAAAVDDVSAWCILALVVAYAQAGAHLINALWTFLLLIGFVLFMLLIVRPVLATFAQKRAATASIKYNMIVFLLGALFLCSWFTEVIGVHAMFGAFILGIVTPRKNRFAAELIERIEDIVVVILLPLYFTNSGLKTDIKTLNSATSWGLTILIIATAMVGKLTGATFAARFIKFSWRDSITIGFLMNTKGLVELIVLNVGLQAGVLNTETFTMFVIMAIVLTLITNPIVYFLYVKHLPKEIENTPEDTFSIVIASQNHLTAPWLVTIASLFSNVRAKLSIKTLFLTEISDRPSSYFFAEFSHTLEPILAGRKRKGLLEEMKAAGGPGMGEQVLSTRNLASSNVAEDVVDYVNSHSSTMVFFDTHHGVSASTIRESKSGFNLRASVSAVASATATRVFNFGTNEGPIQNAIKKAHCAVGVLISKTNTPIDKIHKVLFIYTGDKHEEAALQYVRSFPSTVHVTTVSSGNSTLHIDLPNFSNLDDYDQENTKDNDLIVMGASREESWSGYHSDPVQISKTPVLLIFAPKYEHLKNVTVDDHSNRTSRTSFSSGEGVNLPDVEIHELKK